MHTHCTQQQLTFQPLRRRKVVADFSAGRTSSAGGALLLRELDERFGLTDRLADCFVDHRDQRYVDHSVRELLRQRIYGLCLGYEDLNDHGSLRHDILLAAAVGKCEPAQRGQRNDVALAGSSTLNRLELATRESAAASRYRKLAADPDEFKEFFVDAFIEAHGSDCPERLILDFDASDIELHGKQEERFYQGYYNHYYYLPLYVFCGEQLLVAELRPSKIDGSKGTVPILEWLVPRLRARWPGIEIIVRADSDFSREAIFSCCEDLEVDYVIGIARNKRL